MSTNPFVCQPNLQKMGGYLPFFRAPVAGLITTRSFDPDSVFPAETSPATI